MTDLLDFQMRFDLPINLAKILVLLADNTVVTAEMVEEQGLTKDAKVAMFRLRRRLEEKNIFIFSRRDIGYWLSKSGKDALKESPDHGDSAPAAV